MEMNDVRLITALFQLVVFTTYVGYIWMKFGVLTSISASSFELADKSKYQFTLFCWVLAIPMLFQNWDIFGIVATGGLFFTGISTDHWDGKGPDDLIHQIGSIGAITLLFIAIIIEGVYLIPICFALTCIPFLIRSDRKSVV